MAVEKIQEIISEFHSITIKDDEEEKKSGLIDSNIEINNRYFDKIEAILTDDKIPDDSKVIKNATPSYEIQKSSLKKLQPGKWLNDEVINAYIALIN